jgi:hypothetical protein
MKSHIQFAQALMHLMDSKFSLFGIKFGLDPFLDIWPWFGSFIGAAVSCYLFWIAYKLNVPSKIYWRMGWNIMLDLVLGDIPVIGFFFDLYYKSNEKNLKLLRPYIDPEIFVGKII